MDFIRRIPFLMGATAAVIAGLIGYFNKIENNELYLRMITLLISFWVLGAVLRYYLEKTINEINDRLEKERIEEEARIKLEMMEEAAEKERLKREGSEHLGSKFDLKVHDDDFQPMTVSKVITKEL